MTLPSEYFVVTEIDGAKIMGGITGRIADSPTDPHLLRISGVASSSLHRSLLLVGRGAPTYVTAMCYNTLSSDDKRTVSSSIAGVVGANWLSIERCYDSAGTGYYGNFFHTPSIIECFMSSCQSLRHDLKPVPTPAPTPRPDPIPDETIPGDRDGDYPVPKPDDTTNYIVIGVMLLGMYMILR